LEGNLADPRAGAGTTWGEGWYAALDWADPLGGEVVGDLSFERILSAEVPDNPTLPCRSKKFAGSG
jgi:hypothetical protein